MSLLSQEVLDDVRDLITEITKFQEHDENFTICERYCISHVVHHTYPSVSRSSVKNMIASYASRFYSHGYFKVSEELNSQVENFLSNEKLFEKNPEYDIQWSLLSLLCSLSSNLTSVKQVPKLLPVYDEDDKPEEFNWKEYLTKDLPKYNLEELTSEEDDEESDEGEESQQAKNETEEEKKVEILFDNISAFRSEIPLESQKRLIEQFLKRKKSKRNLEKDVKIRGNISEKIEKVLSQAGIVRRVQLMSEYEMMEHILYQFQSGEKILLRKGLVNLSLTSITQDTLCDYLESLQPYFTIIRSLKDFDDEVSEARYPENNLGKLKPENGKNELSRRKISNMLCVYNVMLKNALEPFQQELTNIVENLDDYTLLKIENKLQQHYFFLTSLYSVHKEAVKGWKTDTNWMASMRLLSVLHNAIINSTTNRMSLLYLNLFLHCFEVYLNIIDNWISFVDLKDPNEDFIIARSRRNDDCSRYEVRDYKTEMEKSGMKPVPLVDSIAEKMIDVGQSLEILRKLNRFLPRQPSKETSFQILVKAMQEKITSLGGIRGSERKPEKRVVKQKGIFTIRKTSYGLRRGNGGGDSAEIFLQEIENEKKETKKEKPKPETGVESYREFIYSMIGNPFFKAAFDDLGVRQAEKKLEEAKQRKEEETGGKALLVVKIPEGGERGLYPFHKIISETFHEVMESRVSSACALVKEIVLKECDLPAHLSLFRSLLLFNDSYLIQSFILTIFDQPIRYSSYSLTLHLKECLRGIYKHHVDALTVTVNNAANPGSILQGIDLIGVNYQVQWPLSLIFTCDVMRKYNEIFRLALKLKWAHWTLSGQHFNREKAIHRIQILRFWFLSDLGRINNYFVAQMASHDLKIDSCNDFKDIIEGHRSFVDKVHRNCLLGDESTENRKLILDLLPLCTELSTEGTDVSRIENTFRNCHNKLSRLMTSLEK